MSRTQLNVLVESDLKRGLAERAAERGETLTELVTRLLEAEVPKPPDPLLKRVEEAWMALGAQDDRFEDVERRLSRIERMANVGDDF